MKCFTVVKHFPGPGPPFFHPQPCAIKKPHRLKYQKPGNPNKLRINSHWCAVKLYPEKTTPQNVPPICCNYIYVYLKHIDIKVTCFYEVTA